MNAFRQRPIEVEAIQLTWENWNDICDFAGVGKMSDGKPSGCYIDEYGDICGEPPNPNEPRIGMTIPTSEGVMIAREKDWIIRSGDGRLHLSKPDIFAETYEPVETE